MDNTSKYNKNIIQTNNNVVILNSIQDLFYRFRIKSGMTMNDNVILSRSEGSHNIEILRSLRSLRMTRGKYLFPRPLRERGRERGKCNRKELINLYTYKPIYFQKPAFTLAESATHVAMPPVFSKAGFTLAEVLITLGIIGIVAAMTIPTLMAKLKNDRESAILKEDYSILQQMMKMANEEGAMGSITSGNNIDQMKEWFDTYFLPYIKTTNACYDKWGCWSRNVKMRFF